MKNEFIPYEQALALKGLGFDESCVAFYEQSKKLSIGFNWLNGGGKNSNLQECTAPLYQQAFRWFRENYHIVGYPIFKGGKTQKTSWYDYIIYSEIDWENNNPNQQWKTYEEAELECLNKLIEIVKNK